MLSEKGGAGNILQKREVFGLKGRVGISAVCFQDNFGHNVPEFISATFDQKGCLHGATKQKVIGISILKRLPSEIHALNYSMY